MLKFYKETDIDKVADYLAARLNSSLKENKSVYWQLPGGSAVKVAVATTSRLDANLLHKLTVSLYDERYGPVGHANSNWQQLTDAGLKLPGATLRPILQGKGLVETIDDFAAELKKDLQNSDYKIGLFGIGLDGHISGILPYSSAVDADNLVAGYEGPDYLRITATFKTICKLDSVIAYAPGESKRQTIENLKRDLGLAEQPAQILKKVKEAIIFNDILGDKL